MKIASITTKNYIYFKERSSYDRYYVKYGVIDCKTGRFLKSTEFPKTVDKYFAELAKM